MAQPNLAKIALSTAVFVTSVGTLSKAVTLTDDFSQNTFNLTGTAVVNLSTGKLHPNLQVYQWQSTAGPSKFDTNIDVGTGRHGSFRLATYQSFSVGGDVSGNIIRIDTDTNSDLNFTDFTLDAGWSIIPVGTQALVIRSQSDISIHGSILCNGASGQAAVVDPTQVRSGGSGACGGGNGGNGGVGGGAPVAATVGSNGVAVASSVSGGGGASVADGSGGGGGGGFNTGAQAPTAATGATPGTIGTSLLDGGFTKFGAGTGGGGGSVLAGSGSGGGGGGGMIKLIAANNLTISATGLVKANGGAGGAGGANGGGGGGGSGGSIQVLSGNTLTIDGVVEALGGSGGASGSGNGGNGGKGRIWTTDTVGSFGGAGSIDPSASGLVDLGVIRYQTGSFQMQSASQATSGSFAKNFAVSAVEQNPSSGSLAIELAGSTSDFLSDDTGFQPAGSFSILEKSKQIKARLTLTNNDLVNPYELDSLSISYDRGSAPEFNYQGGCGLIRNFSNFSNFRNFSNHHHDQDPNSPLGVSLLVQLLQAMILMLPFFVIASVKMTLKLDHHSKPS